MIRTKILIYLCFLHMCTAIYDNSQPIIKSHYDVCLREMKISAGQANKMFQALDERYGCLDACIYKRTRIMIDGKINKNILEYVARKFFEQYGVKDPKIYSLAYLRCAKEANEKEGECKICIQLLKCFFREIQKQ